MSAILCIACKRIANTLQTHCECRFLQQEGMLEQLAPFLPAEHRTQEGLLAVATSAQVEPPCHHDDLCASRLICPCQQHCLLTSLHACGARRAL